MFFAQATSKHGETSNAKDFNTQAEGGNVVGVMERLLAGWDVNVQSEVSDESRPPG
jgi:hypothetical protein